MTDRYYAECMFGGSHRDHNPRGAWWAVTDRESHDADPSVIDYVDEDSAKAAALVLNGMDNGARTIRHAERSRRMKARMSRSAILDADVAARVLALGDDW